LILHANKLTGTIPTELGKMTDNYFLVLNNNALTGRIPSELGMSSKLSHLRLSYNKLTGIVPSQVRGLNCYKHAPSDVLDGNEKLKVV
jgi:hypothetical protein